MTEIELMDKTKTTSKELKEKLLWKMMWRLGYKVALDEFKFMDVFGVRRSGFSVEFEIKVSKSDFNRELRCIHADADKIEKYGKDWEKFIKHRFYLTGKFPKTSYDLRMESLGICTNTQEIIRPNEFNFYVPDYMADYVLEKVADLPYGVVQIGYRDTPSGNRYFDDYLVLKKAVKLHQDKPSENIAWEVARSACVRNKILN
jgi:hypothetical protein